MTQPLPERIGRYRVVSEIGRGAMGVVYRSEDEALGRPVAIKTILASMDAEEQTGYLARFRQEAKALGGLNHPGIITVYEFGDEGGLAYLAMEFLEGRELRDIMGSERLEPAAAVDIAAQVAEGLAFAHARGIVHRDVKPGNVMVLAGNRAKVMDFGIARVRISDVKTQTGMLLGSPKYMAPEQVLGRPVDNRSDIFSLGVVLYEMLAGRPAFVAQDISALMYAVCNARPAPAGLMSPRVSRTLDLIIAKALEKEPDARYQDAAALAADLRACLPELAAAPAQPTPSVSAPAVAAEVPADERTQALGAATMAVPIAGLHVSPRFDSAAALKRLSEPRGEDRRRLSPTAEAAPLLSRWLSDVSLMASVAFVVAAAVAAWFIAR